MALSAGRDGAIMQQDNAHLGQIDGAFLNFLVHHGRGFKERLHEHSGHVSKAMEN
jgi:hypothetical protein